MSAVTGDSRGDRELPIPEPLGFPLSGVVFGISEESVSKSGKQVGVPSEHQVSINEHQVSINLALGTYGLPMLRAAVEEPSSRDLLFEGAGISNAYGKYTRHVLPLLEAGLLEFTLPENPCHRAQRDRLTDLERRVMTEQEGE